MTCDRTNSGAGQSGGAGRIRRLSGLPSIADILLHCEGGGFSPAKSRNGPVRRVQALPSKNGPSGEAGA
jgi:hypothetical protein